MANQNNDQNRDKTESQQGGHGDRDKQQSQQD